MARLPELRAMADEHGLKLISIHDLIVYRLKQESIVEKGVEVNMPTEHGAFRLIPFRQKSNGLEHMAIFKGTWNEDEPILCVSIRPVLPEIFSVHSAVTVVSSCIKQWR